MEDLKDPAIKLFGKTIPLRRIEVVSCSEEPSGAASVVDSDVGWSFSDQKVFNSSSNNTAIALPEENPGEEHKKTPEKELNLEKDSISDQIAEDCKDPTATTILAEDLESPSAERETSSLKSSKSAEQSEISDSQEKTLKKPDKIIPCPRCNSMDTKFCYYNNYNVNQPRHFCKNCQRYWTAGGTMRNVPVGAGRRKNKSSSASHYRHLVTSDALQRAQANAANGIHNPALGGNATVLTFGLDSPLCESMAPALNIVENTQNPLPNGFHGPEQRIIVSNGGKDNGDDRSSCSSITASTSSERGGKPLTKDYQGFPQIPCFHGPPWPYSWNPAQWTSALPSPAFCHSGFPVSFCPAPPYWGSIVPGSWNVQCFSPSSSTTNQSSSSGALPNQSTLGKHSRDGEILNPASSQKGNPTKGNSNGLDRSVLIPKTLRIDDPTEAAKSSIWATLGIKNEKLSSVNGGGLYKAFQEKGDKKSHVLETSPVLQANPAALSRSLRFLEST